MKKITKIGIRVFALIVTITLLLTTGSFTIMTADAANIYRIITEGTHSITLGAGEYALLVFQPTETGLYDIYTTGAEFKDSFLTVSYNGVVVSDDNSGFLYNARLFIKVEDVNNGYIMILAKFRSTSKSGTFKVIVKKSRTAQLYGIDYGPDDINTIPDLAIPYDVLSDIPGYYVNKYESVSDNMFVNNDYRGYARYNSDVVFFSGHGLPGCIIFSANQMQTGESVDSDELLDMSLVKVVFFSACQSATGDNWMEAMTTGAMNAGAQSAVGFEGDVSVASSKKFSDKFYQVLAAGGTVNYAASEGADEVFWWFDPVKDYVVEGDGNTTILPPATTMSVSTTQSIAMAAENGSSTSEYKSYRLHDNVYRYYMTVNGNISNIYYDVDRSSGKIVRSRNYVQSALKDKNNYKVLEINNSLVDISNKIYYDNIMFEKGESEEHIVYILDDDKLVPVKIIYQTYVNAETKVSILEPICINMNNGQFIDYEDIS